MQVETVFPWGIFYFYGFYQSLRITWAFFFLLWFHRWLVEETQKLERQQKLQQQKLMELQQVHTRMHAQR